MKTCKWRVFTLKLTLSTKLCHIVRNKQKINRKARNNITHTKYQHFKNINNIVLLIKNKMWNKSRVKLTATINDSYQRQYNVRHTKIRCLPSELFQ